MKRIISLLIPIAFFSCVNTIEKKPGKTIDSIEQSSGYSKNGMVDMGMKRIDLPFACLLLDEHRFPGKWQTENLDLKNPEKKYKPHVKEFYDVLSCFNKLNGPYAHELPSISSLQYKKVDAEYDIIDSLSFTPDSCQYRLPDFGAYQCYYTYSNMIQPNIESGFLLFYEPHSRSATLLNVYSAIAGDSETGYRLFLVNTDQSIELFEAYSGEETMSLVKKFIIRILPNGEFSIKKI